MLRIAVCDDEKALAESNRATLETVQTPVFEHPMSNTRATPFLSACAKAGAIKILSVLSKCLKNMMKCIFTASTLTRITSIS